VMSVGDDVTVLPGAPDDWKVTTCYEPPLKADSWNNTKAIFLTMEDLFGAGTLVPGEAFDLEVSAEVSTTPTTTAEIGRLRCEIVSVNPLVTRFRANHSSQFLDPRMSIYRNGAGSLHPDADTIEVQGAPSEFGLSIVGNYPLIQLAFAGEPGVTVSTNGGSVSNVYLVHFYPKDPPPGIHHGPYRFCITPLQAWVNKPFTFTSPGMPEPLPPPLTPCVTLHCPSNVVVWTKGESAKVPFDVEARSACGTNVTVVCVPPSGSEFPVGVTWVHCRAADELGNSARCRFPVVVHDREPRLSIDPAVEGWTTLRWPVEFDDWNLERTRDLQFPRWESLGRRSETDGIARLRRVMVGDPKVGDPFVGDPTGFFRLRAP